MTPTPIPEASVAAALLATVPPLLAFGVIMVATRAHPRVSAGISQ